MRTEAEPLAADSRTALRERASAWLLSVFLAVAPASWLPGIPEGLLTAFEWVAVVSAVLLVLVPELTAGRMPFPRGLLGPVGFGALLVLWMPGLAQAASNADRIGLIVDIGSNCAFLWCFYCLAKNGDIVWLVLHRAFVIFGFISGSALLHEALGLALWRTRGRWESVHFAGFESEPTGWAVALAMFLPLAALFFCMPPKRRALSWQCFSVSAAVMLIAGQVVGGGRSGIAATVVTVGGFVLFPFARRFGLILIAVVAVGALMTCLQQGCFGSSEIGSVTEVQTIATVDGAGQPTRTEDAVVALCSLDQLTTRRVAGYAIGAEKLAERPVVGHGLGQVFYIAPDNPNAEIHNLWLKWAVDTGVPAPLLLMAMTAAMLRVGSTLCRDQQRAETERVGAWILSLLLIVGLVVSVFEPWAPFGNFHLAGLWWAAGGVLLGRADAPSPADPPAAGMSPPPES